MKGKAGAKSLFGPFCINYGTFASNLSFGAKPLRPMIGTDVFRGAQGLRGCCRRVHYGSEMCCRYSLIADLGEFARRFKFDGNWLKFESAYNVAPTQDVLTVVGGDARRGGFMRWGLIPLWAKSASIGNRMINAKVETVAEKPAFRNALRRRRCLVPADGFYEWQRTGGPKRPMRIVMRSGEPFAFAGLWAVWEDPDGNRIPSCAVITTTANDLLRPIHDRMPVILPRDMEEFWLDASVDDPIALGSVLRPYADEAIEAYEVSTLVNSAANNRPELTARIS